MDRAIKPQHPSSDLASRGHLLPRVGEGFAPPSSLRAEGEAIQESHAAAGLPRRRRLRAMTEKARPSPSPRWRGEGWGEGLGAHAHNAPPRAEFVDAIGFRDTDPGPSPCPLPVNGARVARPSIPHPTSLREAAFSHKWEKDSRRSTAPALTLVNGAEPSQTRGQPPERRAGFALAWGKDRALEVEH